MQLFSPIVHLIVGFLPLLFVVVPEVDLLWSFDGVTDERDYGAALPPALPPSFYLNICY